MPTNVATLISVGIVGLGTLFRGAGSTKMYAPLTSPAMRPDQMTFSAMQRRNPLYSWHWILVGHLLLEFRLVLHLRSRLRLSFPSIRLAVILFASIIIFVQCQASTVFRRSRAVTTCSYGHNNS